MKDKRVTIIVLCICVVLLIFVKLMINKVKVTIDPSSEKVFTSEEVNAVPINSDDYSRSESLSSDEISKSRDDVAKKGSYLDNIKITEDPIGTKDNPVRYILRWSADISSEEDKIGIIGQKVYDNISSIYSGKKRELALEVFYEYLTGNYTKTPNGNYYLEDSYISEGKVVAVYDMLNDNPVTWVVCILDDYTDKYEDGMSLINYKDPNYENPLNIKELEDNTP